MLQEKMAQLRHLAHESGRAKGPGVTVHQSVQLSTGHTQRQGRPDAWAKARPTDREDLYHYRNWAFPLSSATSPRQISRS